MYFNNLKNKIINNKVKIGIIGLGYVGLPLSIKFTQKNISVVGFDIDKKLVSTLNNGKFHFLTPEDIKGKEELMSVDYTGFGWILVKKSVFESMEYPWFKPLWFQFGQAENGSLIKEFCSEDVGWCKTIKKLGYEIFVDPTIIVGHEKTIVYGRS